MSFKVLRGLDRDVIQSIKGLDRDVIQSIKGTG